MARSTGRAREVAADERQRLVAALREQGIDDERVLAAMGTVDRRRFVPATYAAEAYGDHPLPIGHGQTISQPYVVALMTALIAPRAGQRVLEIGTGCGYQAAVLEQIGCEVWTIELVPELGRRAAETLQQLGHSRVHLRIGDGSAGWPEEAPFDAILVTAAPARIPPALTDQLAVGGRLVIPVGPRAGSQELLCLERQRDGTLERRAVIPVRFVPLLTPGEAVRATDRRER